MSSLPVRYLLGIKRTRSASNKKKEKVSIITVYTNNIPYINKRAFTLFVLFSQSCSLLFMCREKIEIFINS